MYATQTHGIQDEAESAGNVVGSAEEPLRLLGDASIILRDPSAMHLLAAAVLQVSSCWARAGQLGGLQGTGEGVLHAMRS